MSVAIQVANVSRVFRTPAEDVHALRSVSLDVDAGDYLCLYGASGSGKSTLLNVIAGLEVADEGSVEVLGVAMHEQPDAGRARTRLESIGIVFQDDNLLGELTASENIELILEALGTSGEAALREAGEALDRINIGHLAGRLPAEMSGGQRQRVGIARALAGGRSLILADEPTGALDSATSADLFALFKELSQEGVTVLVVTHDPLAKGYASRVLTMQDGAIINTSATVAV